jgi:cytochrome c oxidase cbb3-type subunit I/II
VEIIVLLAFIGLVMVAACPADVRPRRDRDGPARRPPRPVAHPGRRAGGGSRDSAPESHHEYESEEAPEGARKVRIQYNDAIVRMFVWASVLWGIVGMLVGVIIALQLAWHGANVAPYLTFGRLRPLHTNAVIFAFVGNMIFAGVYYSTQRLLKTRMASDLLSKVHFWGWQLIIVAPPSRSRWASPRPRSTPSSSGPSTSPSPSSGWSSRSTSSGPREAQREAPLRRHLVLHRHHRHGGGAVHRQQPRAALVALQELLALRRRAGRAHVQWWYGHNAVAFFLTTPILGIMYYFLPKAAGRPVYSYRLSIIHFWALVFMYIWAGPHHLLYTALPDWAQTLGMIFSVMLWAPSWGGMLNGLLTLRGAWDKVRTTRC